jgi:hypothetical protein
MECVEKRGQQEAHTKQQATRAAPARPNKKARKHYGRYTRIRCGAKKKVTEIVLLLFFVCL